LIPADTNLFRAKLLGAQVRAAPVDHVPMVTAPDTVVDIVMEAVRAIEPHP
jgi:hypothetical protein